MALLTSARSTFQRFVSSESAGGFALMAAAVVAMLIANSPLGHGYESLLRRPVGALSPEGWINDGLMAVFFLLVGLEIKREMAGGALSTWRARFAPGVAAIGGMVVPALIYLAINLSEGSEPRGWAIPAATDIAFALAVLSLLGSRAPTSLKLFLTALAILDDLGAIVVIALFYTTSIEWMALAGAGLIAFIMVVLNRLHVMRLWPYLLLSIALWWFMHRSGVHATIAGVVAAMTIPVRRWPSTGDSEDAPLHRLEHALQPWVAFLVLPLFGLANAGVSLGEIGLGVLGAPPPLGVALGLFLGKQAGVLGAMWGAVKLGLVERPQGASWLQIYGVSLLCGIGFTMSLFIDLLAFPGQSDAIKLGVIAGSLASALAGAAVLVYAAKGKTQGMTTYRPDPRFVALGREFADPVYPADFPKTVLRFRNRRAAREVGLSDLSDEAWIAHFGRFEPLPDNQPQPLAMRYHGHQFRSYNPDLGDGRGFLFAQLRDERDRLLDFGAKGSGKTPWSRTADGRLTLKGAVREILAAEMLEALGVPTSRAFSVIETGEELTRGDEPSPTRSAVLTRLSHSHIRFGTFQRLAYFDRADLIQVLVEHVVETYYPGVETPDALLAAVVETSAILTARWMAAGFVHGVLNTDNMNINGESFDYGPWRFLPKSDPNFTAAYFDQTGLYSFGRQPDAVFWNLQQLAAALTLVADEDRLVDALNGFGAAYTKALTEAVTARLGVVSQGFEADAALVNAAFRTLAAGAEALRWDPLFFDWFGGPASEARAMSGPRASVYDSEASADFRRLIMGYVADRPERLKAAFFSRREPEEMLIDEVEALWAPIAEADDWAPLHAKLERIDAMRRAYDLSPPQ